MPVLRPPAVPAEPDPGMRVAIWHAFDPEPGTRPPFVRAMMVQSVDGHATRDGRSGGLGTPTDHLLFALLRARAGLVVVGARTALAEDYGPAETDRRWAHLRAAPPPPIVLLARAVTREIVDHCERRGIAGFAVAVPADAPGQADATAAGLAVVPCSGAPTGAIRTVAREFAAEEVVLEGGPTVLGAAVQAGQVDEFAVSFSPLLLPGEPGPRITAAATPSAQPLRVAAAFTAPDGGLYTRWVAAGTGTR